MTSMFHNDLRDPFSVPSFSGRNNIIERCLLVLRSNVVTDPESLDRSGITFIHPTCSILPGALPFKPRRNITASEI